MKYQVRTRYGWGFEVVADGYQSHPFESSIDAQTFCNHLNDGDTVDIALTRIRSFTDFRGGRFYCA
jgi:hypothetical protein